MLDTSVAILVRDANRQALERLASLRDRFVISIITQVELEGGVWRAPELAEQRRLYLDAFLANVDSLAFDQRSADAYRRILRTTGFSRRKILDRMIAAQAIVHSATLVTLNPADFADIPELDVLAW